MLFLFSSLFFRTLKSTCKHVASLLKGSHGPKISVNLLLFYEEKDEMMAVHFGALSEKVIIA